MRQTGPRLHRLPQRLDYTLIPAPLDLSLPLVSEKSPLPAIIVTPSSPSSVNDFSIAFLAPPKEPGFFERLGARLQWIKAASSDSDSRSPFAFGSGLRAQTARTLLIIFLILFVMLTHVVTHRMAQTSRRPHLDFSVQDAPVAAAYALGEGVEGVEGAAFRHRHGHGHGHGHGGWFDLSRHWGDARFEEEDEDATRDFVVLA
ncbi:hypothetical protein GYMLUDRAFT_240246 [Collybiopsis luxurians FD-317 M1]|nr:hypothetical protein GYMLUDRAFT_240246 [Collybiopsis luxurians FD-317 M1]